MKAIVLRRRKLGRTSAREVSRFSQEKGHNLLEYRNDRPFPQGVDMVFRWGTTSNLPYKAVVVNEAAAIHYVSDKKTSRLAFAEKGLAPKSWGDIEDVPQEAVEQLPKGLVVRRATHHQGKYLSLCRSFPELVQACSKYPEGYYISEYVEKVAEYRVFLAQGRVVWVARKTPADEKAVAWNVAQGGRFDNVRFDDWPLKAIRVSREAFLMSGLDFGGVDVMVDANGNAFVLEINSAPSQTSPYRQECTAKSFSYIMENGKKEIPVTQERGGWKKFVHPAISNEAIMV